eukprot:gene34379-biopygen28022
MDEAWYSGTVDVTSAEGLTHISYDEGGQEYLNMDKEECESALTERAVRMQAAAFGDQTAADEQGEERTVWTWFPTRHVSVVHACGLGMHHVGRAEMELLRACTYVVFAFRTFGRPDTGVSILREHISVSEDVISERSATERRQLPEAAVGARLAPVGAGQWLGAVGAGQAGLCPGGELLGPQHPQGCLKPVPRQLTLASDRIDCSYWRVKGDWGNFYGSLLANEWTVDIRECLPPETLGTLGTLLSAQYPRWGCTCVNVAGAMYAAASPTETDGTSLR